MADCESCTYLRGLLNDARKEITKLKADCERLSARAKERKKLYEQTVSDQVDIATAVRHTMHHVLLYIERCAESEQDVRNWFNRHKKQLRIISSTALDTYIVEKNKPTNRGDPDKRMPRHGKQSS